MINKQPIILGRLEDGSGENDRVISSKGTFITVKATAHKNLSKVIVNIRGCTSEHPEHSSKSPCRDCQEH